MSKGNLVYWTGTTPIEPLTAIVGVASSWDPNDIIFLDELNKTLRKRSKMRVMIFSLDDTPLVRRAAEMIPDLARTAVTPWLIMCSDDGAVVAAVGEKARTLLQSTLALDE